MAAVRLEIINGGFEGTTFDLTEDEVVIGRNPTTDITLLDEGISREHALLLFDEDVPAGALEIEIFKADHTAYSKKLGRVVMMRDVPDHGPEDFVLLSGTRVREMLAAGSPLPEEFARPEVAQILMDHYQGEAG